MIHLEFAGVKHRVISEFTRADEEKELEENLFNKMDSCDVETKLNDRSQHDKSRLDERIIQTLSSYYKEEIQKELKKTKQTDTGNGFVTKNIMEQGFQTKDFLAFILNEHQEYKR